MANKLLSERSTTLFLLGNRSFNELQLILEESEDPKSLINASNPKSGDRLVHLASRHGRIDVLNLLSKYGADFEAGNLDGKRPLHEAAASSKLTSVQFLLSVRPNVAVDCLKRADWTSLMLACTKKNIEIIKELVDAGADLTLKNKDGWTCFHIASREGHVDILSYMHECNDSLWKTVSKNGRTPLHTAALHGRLEACEFLLTRCHFPVDVQDSCGSTPLMDAARAGFPDIVHKLINLHHADVRKCDVLGRQAIHLASQAGECGVIQYLLKEQNVYVSSISQPNALTPLHFASKEGRADAISYLLQEGADANIQDSKGRTALHMAAGSQNVNSIRLLLNSGAKIIPDKKGVKPNTLATNTLARMLFDEIS